ncbi:MAG: hypothetical protein ACRC6I_07010 [Paracoccaceae bacterium]
MGGGGIVQRSPDGRVTIETEVAPDGAQVIEFTFGSGASGSLPEGMVPPAAAAEFARIASQVQPGDVGYYRYVGPAASATAPVTVALPDFAGVPSTLTSQTTGTRTTTTYTYGTPPASAVATPAASGPAPTRQCNLQMTGGTGYSCAIR